MVAVVAGPELARLPIGRGRPGEIEGGVGVPPWLPVDRPVAWFRGAPSTDQAASADVMARTIRAGVEAGVPVVGVLAQAGLGTGSGLDALCGWGVVAQALTAASGQVPTILVLDGPCLGGPALLLGLVDVMVMTARGQAFVNAPATSARITGSDMLDADLIGGSWVHGARTGVADVVAADLDAAFDQVADLLDLLPANAGEIPRPVATDDPVDRPSRAAADAVPADGRASYDVRDVVADVADADTFVELRAPLRHQRRDRPGPRGRDARRRARQPAQPARGGARHRGLAEGRRLRPLLRRLQPAARHAGRHPGVPSRAATRSGGA